MNITLCEVGETGVEGLESYSPFCVKVHRALRFLGRDYQRRHGMPSDFLPLNPAGKVPVVLFGDEPVADSTRILDRLGVGPTAPGDAAEAYLWEELADVSLNGFVVAARWADDDNWPRCREAFFGGMPAIVRAVVVPRMRRRVLGELEARDVWAAGPDACWARFGELLDHLDQRAPRSGYWLGGGITNADFALFGQLHSLRCELTPWQASQIALRKRLSAYLDRVHRATGG